MSDGTCTVEGCKRPSRRKRGLCNTHYERKRHTGDVGGSEIRRYQPQRSPVCAVVGCERGGRLTRGWCFAHYMRWIKQGDPGGPEIVELPPRGPVIAYATSHKRVVNVKGRAKDHACVDCGKPALDWSYDHADPDEIISGPPRAGMPYSLDPDHYHPRCKSCHTRFDNSH